MKYLVEELKADVNQRDANGMTPLHHAASRGDNEMILYLVSKGADAKAVSVGTQHHGRPGERASAAVAAIPGDDRAAGEARREELAPLRLLLGE